MDSRKFYYIREKSLLLCNPINEAKFLRLCNLFKLRKGAHVLDMACGKGEFLIRLAELYTVNGVGVDISPYNIRLCQEKKVKRVQDADISFIEMDGAKYKSEPDEFFDLSMCIGASWIYGNHRGTLQALKKMTKPGGLISVGEPFWLKEPDEEYLRAEGMKKEDFSTHHDNVKVGEEEGLSCLYTLVSDQDDWDNYETSQWWAADDYARDNPNDPDNAELLERTRKGKETYLRWGRDTLSWSIYIFRRP